MSTPEVPNHSGDAGHENSPKEVLEMLVADAKTRFETHPALEESREPYNLYRASDDAIEASGLKTSDAFLAITLNTSVSPREYGQSQSPDSFDNWEDFMRDASGTALRFEIGARYPELEAENTRRYDAYNQNNPL